MKVITAESRSLPKAKVDVVKGVKKCDEKEHFSPERPGTSTSCSKHEGDFSHEVAFFVSTPVKSRVIEQ